MNQLPLTLGMIDKIELGTIFPNTLDLSTILPNPLLPENNKLNVQVKITYSSAANSNTECVEPQELSFIIDMLKNIDDGVAPVDEAFQVATLDHSIYELFKILTSYAIKFRFYNFQFSINAEQIQSIIKPINIQESKSFIKSLFNNRINARYKTTFIIHHESTIQELTYNILTNLNLMYQYAIQLHIFALAHPNMHLHSALSQVSLKPRLRNYNSNVEVKIKDIQFDSIDQNNPADDQFIQIQYIHDLLNPQVKLAKPSAWFDYL